MMKKANVEDSAAVRTVRMARGSIHLANSPPRAVHSPSVRASLERSMSRSMTPDEREAATNSLQALSAVGIFELLDQDDRVAFIVDLGNRHVYHPGPLGIIFANRALRSYSSLLDLVCGRFKEDGSIMLGETATFPEFKSWVTSFVKEYEAMEVVLPSFTFAGVTWTVSTLRKRFRVVSGPISAEAARISSNPPSAQPLTSMEASPLVIGRPSRSVPGRMEEPKDYFGNIEMAFRSPQPPETTPSKTILSSIETPHHFSRRIISPSNASSNSVLPDAPSVGSITNSSPTSTAQSKGPLSTAIDGLGELKPSTPGVEQGFFDWTRLPVTPALPKHIQFARSIDWASTPLGPIETWPLALRTMCNLIMASPHPAAMYWGEDLIAIYNEPYILLAGQKHPKLMGLPYSVAWKEIWEDVKDGFATARVTGQSTMKDDDRLFIDRSGFLEETYFSWSIIPLVGDDGSVVGLYNPAFEKTRRKIAERRMLTLREVGERTASAREVKSFWGQVLKGLEDNEHDTPFVFLYSISDDTDSDESSMHSNSVQSSRQCVLEGTLPPLPPDHPAAPQVVDLRSGAEGFGPVFREAMTMDKPVLLEVENGTWDPALIDGIDYRGFKERPRAAVVCPIHPTTGESIIGFLVMGINPRRPYDDDYNLFVQLLGRQLATSMASVVLFEEEIRRGQRAAKLAALDRIELSEQLAARTQEAVESETKFTRMAAFAPVGMFIADNEGRMTFSNDAFHKISMPPPGSNIENWMDSVREEDREMLRKTWDDLINKCKPMSLEFRFKSPWEDRNGIKQDNWVLGSAYPEQDEKGQLMTVFGTITNISQQKWAEDYQRRRMEEAVELKRQQTNFMDMTSHEMRNPLSAILQCADEISDSLTEFKANTSDYKITSSLVDSNIDAAQTIALCANHQTRIVSDVLTLSRLDSALLLVTPVDVRPATIVQQALKMFDGELQTADIEMSFVIDQSLDDLKVKWVRLDPSRLLQVLINLTTNAIKFTTTQTKRTITVTMSATHEMPTHNKEANVEYIHSQSRKDDVTNGKDWGDGEQIFLHFSVRDTGKGLTESEKKLLFLRFSQASPKTHVQYGGSGLGLFISRELVELQGGEIGVVSESGKGSTFAFYIKARRSDAPKNNQDEFRPVSSTSSRKASLPKLGKSTVGLKRGDNELLELSALSLKDLCILIVEDNLVNQKVLSKQLRNLGCTVHVANHGGECIEHLQKTRFWRGHEEDGTDISVILMDLEMPVMDGLTCTRKIREYQESGEVVSHIPIIAV
jgi:signal transduction histidine kinase